MLLAKTNTQRSGIRKHTIDRPVRFGQVSFRFVTIALLSAFALLYLAQSTQSASRTYQIRDLEQQRKDLEVDRERLEVEAIRLKSLDTIQKDFSTTPPADGKPVAWEPVKDVAYMSTPKPVAVRGQ